MNLCQPHVHRFHHRAHVQGFTLLELCVVMFILLLFIGLASPAIESAFTEQKIRNDAHELSLMVKTAMQQSIDEHRPYFMEFKSPELSLSSTSAADKNTTSEAIIKPATDETDSQPPADFSASYRLDAQNKLFIPDPDRPHAWQALPSASWLFQPGDLCPLPRLRLVRGASWLEMSFNPLTGNVENEQSYFP